MKNKLVLYLLVSLVASCIYPVTVWAKVNERFSLKNESVSEQIPLTKKVSRKTRSILIPPCSVALLESSLIFSFHSPYQRMRKSSSIIVQIVKCCVSPYLDISEVVR